MSLKAKDTSIVIIDTLIKAANDQSHIDMPLKDKHALMVKAEILSHMYFIRLSLKN